MRSHGLFWHATAGLPAGEGRKPKRLQRYGEAGDRERWFADDDKAADVMQLVKQQRHAGGEDIDANLADNIARKKRFKWALNFGIMLKSCCYPNLTKLMPAMCRRLRIVKSNLSAIAAGCYCVHGCMSVPVVACAA